MNLMTKRATLAAVIIGCAGAAQAQDFTGGYAGIFVRDMVNTAFSFDVGYGAYAGYNFDMGGAIAGAELTGEYDNASVWGGSAFTTLVDARAGYAVAPELLLYGKAGLGYTTGGGGSMVWDAGAGMEYQVGTNVTLRGELDRVDPTAAGMTTQYNAKLGVGYGF